MKYAIILKVGLSTLALTNYAQLPACEKVKELVEWSKDNFRAIKGPEVGRRREQSGREIVVYKSNADLEELQQEEIVYDFEWFWQAHYGDFKNDREAGMDDFKALTEHLKGCLAGYRYKESDKNINEIYEYKGGFTPAGAETATVAVFLQRDPKSKKYYTQLWVKGLKRPY
jgi:hypothetical protein